MTATSIDILIKATTDQAQRSVKALTRVVDDLDDVAGRTDKTMGALGKGFKVGVGVAAAAAAVGVVAVGTALGKSVKAGSDAQEMLSKFNTVFADTSGTAEQVTAEMDAFARQSGRNKYALREMAAGFGDILKPMGFSVEQAGDLSTEMTQLAIDLGSFNNMNPEEAFERLSGTLIGNHENALAFGVIINEATLKEELAAMGADKLTGSLLEQAKVQARINLLMRGTTDAQGDAIKTSGSWANQMLRLKSSFQEVQTEMGLKLLPVLTPFLEMANTLAAEFGPKITTALSNLIGNIDQAKLQEDIDTFLSGLLEGKLITPLLRIDFTPEIAPFTMGDDELARVYFGEKRTISIGDWVEFTWLTGDAGEEGGNVTIGSLDLANFFTWDASTWFDDKMSNVKITLSGEKLFADDFDAYFGEALGDLTIETLKVDGVVVSQKIGLGDLIKSEWTDESGLLYLKIGGITWEQGEGTSISDQFRDQIKTALSGANLFGGGDGTPSLAESISSELEAAGISFELEEPAWWGEPEWLDGGLIDTAWFENFEWPALPTWEWPEYAMWAWSAYNPWVWPAYKIWTWPNKPTWWKWPSAPGWVTDLINALDRFNPFGGGGGNGEESGTGGDPLSEESQGDIGAITDFMGGGQATGTSFFRGGGTWVGETGPEWVRFPRGAEVFPSGSASQMAAAGAGGVTISPTFIVNNEHDAHVTVRAMSNIMRRRGV